MSYMQKIRQFVLAACIAVGLNNNALADTQKLVLTGSSTVAPLALEIGKRFEKLNPGVRIDVQSGGSTRGGAPDLGAPSARRSADSVGTAIFDAGCSTI